MTGFQVQPPQADGRSKVLILQSRRAKTSELCRLASGQGNCRQLAVRSRSPLSVGSKLLDDQ